MDNIVISKEDFRALSSRTRTGIIKLLQERQHTLSELSKKIALADPTVKQHLEILQKAGLVEVTDEGRKWKYYSLTKKGKIIFAEQPEKPIVLLLGITTIAFIVLLLSMFSVSQLSVAREAAMEKNAFPAIGEQQIQEAVSEKMVAMDNTLIILLLIVAIIEGYLIARVLRK